MKRGPKPAPLSLLRVYDKCTRSGTCLLWRGKLDSNGYGQVKRRIAGKEIYYLVHRVVYELLHGSTALHVCHTCDRPNCVDDGHLFAGTHTDNMRDMSRKGRGRPRGKSVYTCKC